MRHICLGLALLAALRPAPALAQGVTLPGSSGQTCVQVRVAGERPSPYDCLNQQLRAQAENAAGAAGAPPLDAASPSNRTGTFNEQSVAEQYGRNFGKSATPYRPPPPIYDNSLSGTR